MENKPREENTHTHANNEAERAADAVANYIGRAHFTIANGIVYVNEQNVTFIRALLKREKCAFKVRPKK